MVIKYQKSDPLSNTLNGGREASAKGSQIWEEILKINTTVSKVNVNPLLLIQTKCLI